MVKLVPKRPLLQDSGVSCGWKDMDRIKEKRKEKEKNLNLRENVFEFLNCSIAKGFLTYIHHFRHTFPSNHSAKVKPVKLFPCAFF